MSRTAKFVWTVITLILAVIACYSFITINTTSGVTGDKILMRLGHGQAGNSEIGGTIAYLSDLAAEDSSKNIQVSVYPGSVLGGETAMIELVQAGVLDMAKISATDIRFFHCRICSWVRNIIMRQWRKVLKFANCSMRRDRAAISRLDITRTVHEIFT